MRKKILSIVSALFMFAVLLPIQAQAAGRDGFRLDENGTVTVVSQHAASEKVSSMSFSLSVESAGTPEFLFNENLAKIQEFRYDTESGKLNIYLAGTEALFAEGADSLAVGKIIVKDESGRETEAKVSVVEDSLQYVYGTEVKTMEDLELPGTVQIGAASTPQVTPPAMVTPTAVPPAQTPEDQDEPEESDGQEAVPTPVKTPASASRPPVLAQGGNTGPKATAAPPALSQGTGNSSGSTGSNPPAAGSQPVPAETGAPEKTPEVTPEKTPEKAEDLQTGSEASDEKDGEQASGSKGLNVLLIIVVVVVLVVVAVEVVAFTVVKKKPKDRDR